MICNTKDPFSNVLHHRKKNHTLFMVYGLKGLDMGSVHEITEVTTTHAKPNTCL